MARRIEVQIIGDSKSLERAFTRASASGRGFSSSLGKVSVGLGTLVKSAVVFDVVNRSLEGLNETVHEGISEFSEHAQIAAQTAAALKSTGSVANVTADQIDALALKLSNLSGVDDEVIQKGENLLLSFTNIRNFAGKNNDIFTQATKVMLDFSIRTGRDAASAAVILGRALEDPARRVSSLSRAGVVFTKAQIEQLKVIEKTKGVFEAQKVLLKQLEVRFQGAAAAAGKTLPGQLAILHDRFKDLAGQIVGVFAPATAKGAAGLTDFVRRISEAHGFQGKALVVKVRLVAAAQTVGNFGKQLFDRISREVSAIRWDALGRLAAAQFRRFVTNEFSRIDFRAAGSAVGRALTKGLNTLSGAIAKVDWSTIGRKVVDGAAIIAVSLAKFLLGINWTALFKAFFRLAVAAVRAQQGIMVGALTELGHLIIAGLGKALAAAGDALERAAIGIVLKIIEPFSHLPGFLGGGPFQDLKRSLHETLDAMTKDAANAATSIGASVAKIAASSQKPIGSRTSTAGFGSEPNLPPPPPAAPRQKIDFARRNSIFDSEIGRILLRGGLGTLQAQLAAISKASALITQRIARTKDITRKLNLEDQLLQLVSQAKALRSQLAQDFIDSLQFAVTKAQATANFGDDLQTLAALQAGIKARIASEGKTLDLEQRLFDVQQQIVQARRDQAAKRIADLAAKQFKQLGLTATGDDITPGVANLKKRLQQLSANLVGSTLDTPKLEAQLARFRKVLSEGLVPKDVRAKIKDMLDGIAEELKNHSGKLTKFAKLDTSKFVQSITGLTPAQVKQLRAGLSQLGANGTVPIGRVAAAGAGAGGGGGADIVIQHTSILDGAVLERSTTRHQQKRKRRNPPQKRGPHAGA